MKGHKKRQSRAHGRVGIGKKKGKNSWKSVSIWRLAPKAILSESEGEKFFSLGKNFSRNEALW